MSWRRIGIVVALSFCFGGELLLAADPAPAAPAGPKMMSLGQLFEAGGTIGYVITGLSFVMVALIVEHLISLRQNALIPPGLADSIHHHLALRHFEEARQQCQFHPSFLAYVVRFAIPVLLPFFFLVGILFFSRWRVF